MAASVFQDRGLREPSQNMDDPTDAGMARAARGLTTCIGL